MAASLGAESERWCIVLIVVERDGGLVLVVEPTRLAVPCPQCAELSRRQHSHYDRHPLDLPWRGTTVRMRVHSRCWFCDTPTCPRKIFAERFDGALARYARRTNGTTALLTSFALQAGGEGGARLAQKIGVPISPDTLLRILHSLEDDHLERGPRVLGVDDVALRRKQRRYGYDAGLVDEDAATLAMLAIALGSVASKAPSYGRPTRRPTEEHSRVMQPRSPGAMRRRTLG